MKPCPRCGKTGVDIHTCHLRPTPETDAQIERVENLYNDIVCSRTAVTEVVPADFARQLERERDELETKMLEARGERNCLRKVADAYHKCICSVTTGSEVGQVIQAYNNLPHVKQKETK